ncbi:hypothetical protein HPB48_008317 [Haemaphysalis longicornis]|uniref:Granulins domain-containing protein n=1 Tax=Haemaphysalis longicornis TaxID=44386 RepID=A0A9J6FTX7_HAELO|nr:hypothetical protein HPB48_008317 [Haemaphysalis longicornis]
MSCCPEGYRCKMSTHQCIHATTNHTLPMLRKVDPIVRNAERVVPEENVGSVRCPDGNYCQDGQTCCLLASGSYGCCPYQHAECCSDHSSCCPEGYQCKISTHQCIHATTNHTLPMLRKVSPIFRSVAELGNAEATCCEDYVSCCPEGYRCIITLQKCVKESTEVAQPMNLHSPFTRAAWDMDRRVCTPDVICPDKHKCLSGQTCCQLSSGKYGCCPLPDAVCCEDHKSCCPQGYVCHVETQTCQFGDHSIPMVRKGPAILDASAVAVPGTCHCGLIPDSRNVLALR